MIRLPSVFASLENAAANQPESSTKLVAAISDICILDTFFHDHTPPSLTPNAIILEGFNGLSGFFRYATEALLFSSFSNNSEGLVIRNCLYFSLLSIRFFSVLKCSFAWFWDLSYYKNIMSSKSCN